MSDFTAVVPFPWLPKFLGYKIWFRPDKVADCDWRELVEVGLVGGVKTGWTWHNGQLKSGTVAQMTTVKGIPQSECEKRTITDRGRTYSWWEWQPPQGALPPDMPIHDRGYTPRGYPIEVTPAPAGNDGALFTL